MAYKNRYRILMQNVRFLFVSLFLLMTSVSVWGQIIIEGLPESVCKNDAPYALVPAPPDPGAVYQFSGLGVSGNQASGYYYDPASPDVPVGDSEIRLDYTPSGGILTTYFFTVNNRFIPTLDFTATPACIPSGGGLVQFNNLTSGKFSVATWSWNFGDPASGSGNTSSQEAPNHFYPRPGSWDVSLSAVTTEGCAVQDGKTIVLADEPAVDFTWLSDCYIRGQKTGFMDRSVSGFSDINSLVWTFRTTGGGVLGTIGSNNPEDTIYTPFPAMDTYNITLRVQNDAGCIGTLTKPIVFRPVQVVTASGFKETFDNDNTNWMVVSDDGLESWVLGEPDFNGFEPVSGDRGWYTDLPVHTTGYVERSWVQSQCYDFTQLSSPLVLIDVMKSFIPGTDGAVLQYQDFVSEDWKTVGVVDAGQNWYNSWGLFNEPGGSPFGWGLPVFEPDEAWVHAGYPIDELGGISTVKFRVVIGSGGTQASGNQGFAFDNFYIGQRARYSVLEHFTNSASESAATADQVVEKYVSDHPDIVIDLQYHMDYPGEDPMNQNNPVAPSVRAFNYGVPGVPYAVLNGGAGPEFRYDFSDVSEEPDEEVLLEASLEIPPFDLTLDVDFRSNSLSGSATANCVEASYPSNIQLYVVVIEEEVTAYTGAANTSLYRNVVLDILPNPAGQLLGNDWGSGDSETFEFGYTYAAYVEDVDDLAVVAFLFDRDLEKILQAGIIRASPGTGIADSKGDMDWMTVYPNPAQETVYLNLGKAPVNRGQIAVMDLSGRLLMDADIEPGHSIQQLDISGLSEGVYLVNWVESGVSKGRAKFVLTR
jgi:hypothetical protein